MPYIHRSFSTKSPIVALLWKMTCNLRHPMGLRHPVLYVLHMNIACSTHDSTHILSLQRTATHCNALQRTATHCNALQRSATLCNALQRTATHCNALQRTATHYNALQRTATSHSLSMSSACILSILHMNIVYPTHTKTHIIHTHLSRFLSFSLLHTHTHTHTHTHNHTHIHPHTHTHIHTHTQVLELPMKDVEAYDLSKCTCA